VQAHQYAARTDPARHWHLRQLQEMVPRLQLLVVAALLLLGLGPCLLLLLLLQLLRVLLQLQ
jgi:hypothetical protein